MFFGAVVLGLAGLSIPANALAPDWSLPPRLRAQEFTAIQPSVRPTSNALIQSLPPRLRPGFQKPTTEVAVAPTFTDQAVSATSGEIRLCRDRQIRGATLAPIQGQLSGCGLAAPVRVSSIAGVNFVPAAIMDCDTARAAREWLDETATPAWGRLGGGLQQVQVAASYACRPGDGGQPQPEDSEAERRRGRVGPLLQYPHCSHRQGCGRQKPSVATRQNGRHRP